MRTGSNWRPHRSGPTGRAVSVLLRRIGTGPRYAWPGRQHAYSPSPSLRFTPQPASNSSSSPATKKRALSRSWPSANSAS